MVQNAGSRPGAAVSPWHSGVNTWPKVSLGSLFNAKVSKNGRVFSYLCIPKYVPFYLFI